MFFKGWEALTETVKTMEKANEREKLFLQQMNEIQTQRGPCLLSQKLAKGFKSAWAAYQDCFKDSSNHIMHVYQALF